MKSCRSRRQKPPAFYARSETSTLFRPNLEHLTKPSDLVEADEGATQDDEGLVDVGAPLVADGEAAEAAEPGQGSLNNPSVPAQPRARLHATSSDAGPDGAGAALLTATTMVVGLVGVELLGPPTGPALAVPHARHRVEGGRQHQAVVPVRRAQTDAERRAPSVDHKVALRARFASIRRVRAGLGTPLLAGTDALSRLARLQSSCPASERRSRSTR
jgi:hypothetical protein